jgi:two-component system, OmpR family, sensor kinase
MDLRQVRIRLTLLNGVLSALAIALVTVLAIRSATSQIATTAEREAETRLTELLPNYEAFRGQRDNTWLVSLDGERSSSEPFGSAWLEPPLGRLAKQAMEYSVREVFHRGSGGFVAVARKVNDTQALVVAFDLKDTGRSQGRARRDIALAGFGSWLLATLAGWWVAGRSLAPARRALRQQREFIADAAHEMRTPLATIRASASQALLRDRDSSAYRESLSEILDAASRARQGVDELLELARLEAGQVTLRTGPLRLDFLVDEVVAGIREDGCQVTQLDGDPSPVTVDADYGLLRQALDTVVRNAVVRAETVSVEARRVGDVGVITVDDDGPGIAPELLPVVFDRFRRGDTKGGVGLGMAIAKRIVELHDGTVTAENREGGGARVTLRVPVGQA